MAIEVISEFIAKATVRTIAYIYDDDGELTDPATGGSIKVSIWDPNGVQKAGYISVVASTSFTAGLVVTGAISGAKGVVISKPDETTLELQQVTGIWQDDEGITDADSGTSTTTSALLGADMTKQNAVTGVYEYYYQTTSDSEKGWWRGEVDVIDGTGEDAKTSIGNFPFRVR
ncbi:hypothetical protein ES703_15823 [subsurface metagenome]